MLTRLLEELEAAQQPLTLQELSTRLGVEPTALEGMLQTLLRMGKLRDDREAAAQGCALHCAGCAQASECALLARLPRTYSLVRKKD
ncbi:MAG: FeoC-like transcriptional regulator [Anaerolineae bacterium]